MNKKNVFTIYVLLVCLVTVITLTVMIGGIFYNAVRIAAPLYTLGSYEYKNYSSNERYIEYLKNDSYCRDTKDKCPPIPTTEEEITAKREKRLTEELMNEKRSAVQEIIQTVPYFILFLLVGFFHWRLFRTIKE